MAGKTAERKGRKGEGMDGKGEGKSSVERSPYKGEIRELLEAGWSAEKVREYLTAKYGADAAPHARAILRYRQRHLAPKAVVPINMIREAMKRVRYRVNTLKIVDMLLWAQEERIAMAWQRERETRKMDPQLDPALRVALEYIEARCRMAAELGVERAGKVRMERHQTEVLEMPESHLQELLSLLRRRREESG